MVRTETVTQRVTSTVTETATETVAAPTPTAVTGDHSLRLRQMFNGGEFTVVVYEYRRDSSPGAPSAGSGQRWDSINVRTCLRISNATVSWVPWALLGRDEGRYQGSNIEYNQFPSPTYPDGDQPLAKNQCVRGWITFAVPKSTKITAVQYTLNDGDATTVVSWGVR